MSIKQVKINADDITIGMFVSCLDRPWSQTPFPIQGFVVQGPKEITALRAYCDYVYIDITKGRSPITGSAQSITPPNKSHKPSPRVSPGKSEFTDYHEVTPIQVRRDVYQQVVPLTKEVEHAEKALLQLRGQFTLAAKQIAKGREFDYQGLKDSVADMVNSVVRCPDAFTWLLRLRLKDQQTHDHSMRSALWAVQFARYIGMQKDEITILCLGTLLKDIGKVKLSNSLLRKKVRTAEEEKAFQQFVTYGVEMLRESNNVEPRVISVVRYHCERHDGSGFPEGLSGGKIPLLARISGMASTYDAISNPREAAEPVASSRAVSLLYNMRDKKFTEDLVVEFIQSVGLYPTGTLVELTTGDVGIVIEQHHDSRLTPKVAVLDQEKALASGEYILLDLKDEDAARKALISGGRSKAASVAKLAIARDLEPSGYDVDLESVTSVFMSNASQILGRTLSNDVDEGSVSEKSNKGFLASIKARFQQ